MVKSLRYDEAQSSAPLLHPVAGRLQRTGHSHTAAYNDANTASDGHTASHSHGYARIDLPRTEPCGKVDAAR